MQTKKKVLMLASVASMIDQFNMPNIRLLLDMGYEVHAACNFNEGNTCDSKQIEKLQRTLEKMGVVWHQWDCPRSVRPLWKCRRAYRQLLKLTRQHVFAWMHCHSPVGGALARIAAHRQKIRVVYTAHGFHFFKGASFKNWLVFYPVEKLLAHWTDVLVTVNQEDYRLANRKLRAGRVCFIPGVGIDSGCFRKPADPGFRRKYRIPREALLLLSVGELSRRKNHRIVLQALAALKEKEFYYLVCGQGDLQEDLMRCARELGVSRRIRMMGFMENVKDVYRNADIFVFPSLQEGMPAALMEAMAAGLPCVVSDIRGNRELIDEAKGGMRFAAGDTDGLCHALLSMTDGRKRKAYGVYNQKKIQDYDISAVLPQMAEIYEEMAGF